MLLYGNTYCDNNLEFTELYPVDIKKGNFKAGTFANFWMRDHYNAVFILEGSLRVTNYHASFNVKGGQFFIIDPYNHCRIYPNANSSYIKFGFSGTRSGDFAPVTNSVFSDPAPGNELSELLKRKDLHDVHLISFLFSLYSSSGVHTLDQSNKKSLNPYVKMLVDNIDHSYLSTEYSLEALCREIGLNPKYLSRLFKSETGISMQDYLKRRRLDAAYKLLTEGYKVNQVAFRCGIRDAANFSEMFKKYYGIRPSEVSRKNHPKSAKTS